VGTELAREAMDGCLQPERFDSSVLRTVVHPNWNCVRRLMPFVH
jgi:hypothetical protein